MDWYPNDERTEVQTFLISSDFAETARVLDRQRLGKQRVETMQIMKALCDPSYGWQNHPAVKMWRGHAGTLLNYQHAICDEWRARGYKDTCDEKTTAIYCSGGWGFSSMPEWLFDETLHLSHKSNLIRKDAAHYGPLFPGVPDNLPYVWPEESA